MDETRYEGDEDVLEGTANKKYTFFVIDGSPAMFETSKEAPECEFRIAIKVGKRETSSLRMRNFNLFLRAEQSGFSLINR